MLSYSKVKLLAVLCLFALLFSSFVYAQQDQNIWRPANSPLMTKWSGDVSLGNVLKEYPRPQMVRDEWKNLNGLWDYAIIPKDESRPAKFDGKILVPFAVESALSGVGKPVEENNKLWYRKMFAIPSEWNGKKIRLRFDAVDWEAEVWVNGQYAGNHRGGYDPFSFDVTSLLNKNKEQEIIVSVWDPSNTGTQPRGKQVKKPGGIMYTSVTGIWQTVWLEPLPETNIESLKIIPGEDLQSVTLTGFTNNPGENYKIHASVYDGAKPISQNSGKAGDTFIIKVPDAKLWWPDSPHLYDVKVSLISPDGKIMDSVSSYFGMRKISLGKDDAGITKMLLNNKFIFQFGFLDQGWWPDGLYTAPTDEALRFDVEITKRMGFNLARKHVKVEPDRWYYWCDKLGLIVWQDMPSGDKSIGTEDPDIARTKESAEQYLVELNAMIKNKINHPSIVMWVPYNEGWGQWNTSEVVNIIRKLDPSRLVDAASGWTDRYVGDVNDIHDYPGPSMPELEKNRAVVLGEFGGLGLPLEGHTWKDKGSWGYRNLVTPADLQKQYEDLINKLMSLKLKGLSAAVYTQTTDVEVEVNGLMTYDRAVTKIDPGFLSKINRGFVAPVIESESKIFLDSLSVRIVDVSPGGVIRYTVDGSGPEKNSLKYSNPITVKNDAVVKAKLFWPDGTESKTAEEYFKKVLPVKSSDVGGLKPGLEVKLYKNNDKRWSEIPDWNLLVPEKTGTTGSVSIDFSDVPDDFGLVFNGYIKIPETAVYSFYLDSDDGSRLLIDNERLIDNDKTHGMIEIKNDIALSPGYHAIQIQYFQGMGGKGLSLKVSGPGFTKRIIESKELFH